MKRSLYLDWMMRLQMFLAARETPPAARSAPDSRRRMHGAA